MPKKTSKLSQRTPRYSLWTLPHSEWEDPLRDVKLPEGLAERMAELRDQIKLDEEQLRPFGTPVTAEDLSLPTESG